MKKAKRYRKPLVEVEALQFTDWDSFVDIARWSGKVYYVPTGQEHELRDGDELKGLDDILPENAIDFLVVKTPGGEKRANKSDYVIRDAAGDMNVMTQDEFKSTYELVAL